MKKIISYIAYMLLIILLIPFLIVRSCSVIVPDTVKRDIGENGNTNMIKVFNTSKDEVQEMELEEYIKGVIAAEMPAEFQLEALKAQAVAARTNAYAKISRESAEILELHKGASICSSFAHCQAWISVDEAKSNWGIFSSQKYWNKISQAVEETRGIVMTYEGKLVLEPLYHACSAEKTENSGDVFTYQVPYLLGVPTKGDEASPNYSQKLQMKSKDFINKITSQYPDFKLGQGSLLNQIDALGYTEGQRIKEIKVGNKVFKGTEFRTLLGLHSTKLTIDTSGDNIIIKTLGDGHGVGMSQWGANQMAQNGENYEGILKYYYTGIDLNVVDQTNNGL